MVTREPTLLPLLFVLHLRRWFAVVFFPSLILHLMRLPFSLSLCPLHPSPSSLLIDTCANSWPRFSQRQFESSRVSYPGSPEKSRPASPPPTKLPMSIHNPGYSPAYNPTSAIKESHPNYHPMAATAGKGGRPVSARPTSKGGSSRAASPSAHSSSSVSKKSGLRNGDESAQKVEFNTTNSIQKVEYIFYKPSFLNKFLGSSLLFISTSLWVFPSHLFNAPQQWTASNLPTPTVRVTASTPRAVVEGRVGLGLGVVAAMLSRSPV